MNSRQCLVKSVDNRFREGSVLSVLAAKPQPLGGLTRTHQPLEFYTMRAISVSHDTAPSSHHQDMGLVGSDLTQCDKLFVLALQLWLYKGYFMNDLSCYYESCKSTQTILVFLLDHKHNPFHVLLQAL